MGSGRDDRGSAPVEVALLAPVILGFLMVVIFAGRVAYAEAELQAAASAAARAASQQASVGFAQDAATKVVDDNLADAGIVCSGQQVEITDPSAFEPGGSVDVEVACTIQLEDLMFFTFPGNRTVRAHATEVIDTFRGGGS